ncbi:phosphatidylinositol 4-kinase beta 1-like isoform X1 [Dioscorea cayenensis subsp. rotundata]|uniref:1-phosphatidylinositol 4-kinase n=1 Tax=Dioscorea cayennensis subsp. rotundata TaxID=55577 RepID=A0AB40B5F1_DIOCR|nr:phosphatidylinositol 4-kinase beta 1-like isoform X1 [Dioscorea cayenensis subsp. rotundata]
MARLLGLGRAWGSDRQPREIAARPGGTLSSAAGENGWLVRFFDSAFFCEWIAVSYLYKHPHPGVRDYLCNRMYALPLTGIEAYLFQISYMLVHLPSPSLDKFVIDTCAKSLRIALKVHWFLMAELEDSDDSEGISRIQEKCQIAATLMGEWPPLIRPAANESPTPKNPVLNRLLSSKQRLLSLTSSPEGSPSDENSKILKKLVPGPKLRDTLLFRKSMEKEKEEEESDKDGFFKRFLRDSKEKEEDDGDKEGFFKRFLRDSKDREDEDGDKDGFFRRLLSKEKEGEEGDKDGFFRKFLKDSKDEEEELAGSSSDGFFKRLFRDKEEKLGGEDDEIHEKEGFLKRIFKDKNEIQEEKCNGSVVDEEKEGFFKRLFKDKNEEKKEDEVERGRGGHEDDEKDGFFRRIFKDKNEDRRASGHSMNEEDDKCGGSVEESEKEGFFRRMFKDKNDERKDGVHDRIEEDDKRNGSIDEAEKDGFFRRIFKEKHDEKRDGRDKNEESSRCNESLEEEETSEILSFRRLFRVHPEEAKTVVINENGINSGTIESSPGTENFFRRLFRDRDQSIEDSELFGLKKHKEKRPGSPRERNEKSHAKPPLPTNIIAQIRKGTYHASLEFVQTLCDTSYGLVDIFPIEDRKSALRESLVEMNSHLADAQNNGVVCFPMGKGMYRVVHIPEDEAVLLNSREKAPYLICVEVLKGEAPSSTKEPTDGQKLSRAGIPLANGDAQLPKPPPWAYPLWIQQDMYQDTTSRMLRSTSEAIDRAMAQLWEAKVKFVHVNFSIEKKSVDRPKGWKGNPNVNGVNSLMSNADHDPEWVHVSLSAVPGVNMEDVDEQEPPRRKDHRRVPSTIAMEEVKAAAAKGQAPPGLPLKLAGQDSSDVKPKLMDGGIPKPGDALSGELWEVKKERIRRSSIYGKLPGWDLRSIIVKSGDDCRQEHLAVQLVAHFYDIYQEAGLPLWLRPYEVLVTSSYTALIETIPDTASLHSLKSRFPNISSLREFFVAKYEENSPNFKLAQRNFVESMAGYSILCYLLQVKDRHNGNLLLDEEGHIIHIDFGFMLSNSPGGVNFESAPFKLTRELLEVMDSDAEGTPSEFFDYFKVLCIQGFLTCRKHAERIILLVEMLQDSGFPCFKGGPRTIQNLRKRFHLNLTEEQCVSLVLSLISSSLDAWRTRQYDYYQRVLNGIL